MIPMSVEEIQELRERSLKMSASIERIEESLLGTLENPGGAMGDIKALKAHAETAREQHKKMEAYMLADKELKDNWKGRLAVITFIAVPFITIATSLIIKVLSK